MFVMFLVALFSWAILCHISDAVDVPLSWNGGLLTTLQSCCCEIATVRSSFLRNSWRARLLSQKKSSPRPRRVFHVSAALCALLFGGTFPVCLDGQEQRIYCTSVSLCLTYISLKQQPQQQHQHQHQQQLQQHQQSIKPWNTVDMRACWHSFDPLVGRSVMFHGVSLAKGQGVYDVLHLTSGWFWVIGFLGCEWDSYSRSLFLRSFFWI